MSIRTVAPQGQPAVGTIYRTPDDYILRIRYYDQRIAELMDDRYVDGEDATARAPWHPQWSCLTPTGGATSYSGDLPEGSILLWSPGEPEAAPAALRNTLSPNAVVNNANSKMLRIERIVEDRATPTPQRMVAISAIVEEFRGAVERCTTDPFRAGR